MIVADVDASLLFLSLLALLSLINAKVSVKTNVNKLRPKYMPMVYFKKRTIQMVWTKMLYYILIIIYPQGTRHIKIIMVLTMNAMGSNVLLLRLLLQRIRI